jgi:hypothetical protein
MTTDETGWTKEAVRRRYERYMQDHHGELDVANLCETMANWGANRMFQSMVTFSDIGPQLGRLEHRLAEMRAVVESMSELDESEATPDWHQLRKV